MNLSMSAEIGASTNDTLEEMPANSNKVKNIMPNALTTIGPPGILAMPSGITKKLMLRELALGIIEKLNNMVKMAIPAKNSKQQFMRLMIKELDT